MLPGHDSCSPAGPATSCWTAGSRQISTKLAAAVIDLLGQFEHFARRPVDQHHLAVRVGDDDAFGHAAQDCFEFFALLGQGLDVAHHRVGGGDQALLGEPHEMVAANQTQRMALGLQLIGGDFEALAPVDQHPHHHRGGHNTAGQPYSQHDHEQGKGNRALGRQNGQQHGGWQDAEQHRNHQAADY